MILNNKEYDYWFDYIVKLLNWRFSIPNSALREDLAQEILYKIIYKYEEKRGVSLKTFVFHVAKNLVIDYTRKKKLITESDDVYDNTKAMAKYSNETVETAIIEDERNSLIKELLDILPKDNRDLMEDKYFLGLKYREISKKRGIPVGSIKTNIFRSKKQLQEKFANQKYLNIFVK